MLCSSCYLCKVNIGVLLPEATLVPLGGGEGWTGHSMQDASNCPASQVTPLQAAKLSWHVALASPFGSFRCDATQPSLALCFPAA